MLFFIVISQIFFMTTSVNSNLRSKLQIITITGQTGSEGSIGVLDIPRSSYPTATAIIPFGYDTTLIYRVGIFDVGSSLFRLAVQVAVTGAWADNKTVTFMALLIN